MRSSLIVSICLCVGLVGIVALEGAPPTAAQRKVLTGLSGDLKKIPGLIGKKKTDEAQAAITEVETALDAALKDAEYPANDRQVAGLRKALETQKAALEKAMGGGKGPAANGGISFAKDVAPILADKCGTCHSADRRAGGLCLESYAALEQGGTSGPLLVPGNPNNSLLMARLAAPNPNQRMPKNAEALSPDDLRKVAAWIASGAKFDGTDKTLSLSLLKNNPDAASMKLEIPKPKGTETVSFIKDIAPTFVGTCGGCHGMNNPRSDFSLATFERLMIGGATGKVIVPGNPDESRLWRLVNADDTPVMPQGAMAGITRKFHTDLRTWIAEGASFDGNDPKRPLREMIATPEQMRGEELAKLTPEGWEEKRRTDAETLWKRTFPQGEAPLMHETPEFLVVGDVAKDRLEDVGAWAETQAKALRTMFDVSETPLFKGRLILFVFKERFGYEEFNNTIHRRQVPREVMGHADVSANQDQALAAVQDLGDEVTQTSPGTELNVAEQVTSAFLKRDGGDLPDWLTRGTGLAIVAGKSGAGNPYMQGLRGQAAAALAKSNLQNPADLFADGQFSPADVGPIGYALVEFLLKQGGAAKFGILVQRLRANDSPPDAVRTAYAADARQLGLAFLQAVGSRKR